MVPLLSPQAQDIQERLNDEGVSSLFHWTSIKNLPCIEQTEALCSKGTLENMEQWPCPCFGGRGDSHDRDRRYGNWDKVGLNFTPHTPMVYWRKRDGKPLCFFIISTEVATWRDVVFTNENAARHDHKRGTGMEGLRLVDFDAIRSEPSSDESWRRPVQAEVLVPDRIPLDYVECVVFVSEASCAEGERIWGPSEHPRFKVAPRCFSDGYRRNTDIPFPFVDRVILTDKKGIKGLIDRPYEHCTQFTRDSTEYITGILRVHALSGSTIRIRVEPASIEFKKEYAVTRSHTGRFKVPMNKLLNGKNTVIYYIDDIRWAQVDFEVEG